MKLLSRHLFLLLLLLGALAPILPAQAVQPDEMLADPVLESRARALSAGLRCLVCQNQSIDDSNADLAHDLRLIVRQRLLAGDDDAAVLRYVTARYGDYVLLKPPVKPGTWLLWGAPALLLLLGVVILRARFRSGVAAPADGAGTAALTPEERQRLRRLLPGRGRSRSGSAAPGGGKGNSQ